MFCEAAAIRKTSTMHARSIFAPSHPVAMLSDYLKTRPLQWKSAMHGAIERCPLDGNTCWAACRERVLS